MRETETTRYSGGRKFRGGDMIKNSNCMQDCYTYSRDKIAFKVSDAILGHASCPPLLRNT